MTPTDSPNPNTAGLTDTAHTADAPSAAAENAGLGNVADSTEANAVAEPVGVHATTMVQMGVTAGREDEIAEIAKQVATGAKAALEKLATDVVSLAVGPLVGITDFYLLVSARNDRQLRAVTEAVEDDLRIHHQRKPIGREGSAESGWLVVDYGDFVLHAFTAETRETYDLERLWADAEKVTYTDEPELSSPGITSA